MTSGWLFGAEVAEAVAWGACPAGGIVAVVADGELVALGVLVTLGVRDGEVTDGEGDGVPDGPELDGLQPLNTAASSATPARSAVT